MTKSKTPLLVPFDKDESKGRSVINNANTLINLEILDQKNTIKGTIKILEKAIKKRKILRNLFPLSFVKTRDIFSLYASPGKRIPLIADSIQNNGFIKS